MPIVRRLMLWVGAIALLLAVQGPVLASEDEKSTIAGNALTAQEQADGWSLLFDGQSLEQWRTYGAATVDDRWQIEGDAMVLTRRGGGDLITREQYTDFELSLEWLISEGGNSGIFVLADESDLPIFVHAPEIQILDDTRHGDGRWPNRRSGSLYDMVAAPADSQRPAGAWNEVKIRLAQGHLQVWQNDIATVDIQIGSERWNALRADSKFAEWKGFGENTQGYIGLQDHGDRVAFKNLKIRRLVADE